MGLVQNLKRVQPKPRKTLWLGPEVDGITFSLLCRFLVCRERFRIYVKEGLVPRDDFNHRIEYGNLWHTCEEAIARGYAPGASWEEALKAYAVGLAERYPLRQEEVQHWYHVCLVQFRQYLSYQERYKEVGNKTELFSEKVFAVPYQLPSGRKVILRGKWDSVFRLDNCLVIQENKTKGDIDEQAMVRQLQSGMDLQTMIYIAVLQAFPDRPALPISGIRYNVIRRPLSGGKGTIRRHQPSKSNPYGESQVEFYQRLAGIIKDDPSYFFMRWKVDISPIDMEKFRNACLNPILENLCAWWDSQNGLRPPTPPMTWIHPYGVWNPFQDGGSHYLDEYLRTGSEVGLERTDTLFRELEG